MSADRPQVDDKARRECADRWRLYRLWIGAYLLMTLLGFGVADSMARLEVEPGCRGQSQLVEKAYHVPRGPVGAFHHSLKDIAAYFPRRIITPMPRRAPEVPLLFDLPEPAEAAKFLNDESVTTRLEGLDDEN
jgi:hypothetical protein